MANPTKSSQSSLFNPFFGGLQQKGHVLRAGLGRDSGEGQNLVG